MYKELLIKGFELVTNFIIDELNKFQMGLAKKWIRLIYSKEQKEVDNLRQRTSEGIEATRLDGK